MTPPKIVGHLGDQPIYELPAMPQSAAQPQSDGHVCSSPEPPCLACILNDLVPVLDKLEVKMQLAYKKLLSIQQIRIDSTITQLEVDGKRDILRRYLAVAQTAHNTLTALLESAATALQQ